MKVLLNLKVKRRNDHMSQGGTKGSSLECNHLQGHPELLSHMYAFTQHRNRMVSTCRRGSKIFRVWGQVSMHLKPSLTLGKETYLEAGMLVYKSKSCETLYKPSNIPSNMVSCLAED